MKLQGTRNFFAVECPYCGEENTFLKPEEIKKQEDESVTQYCGGCVRKIKVLFDKTDKNLYIAINSDVWDNNHEP